MSVSFFGDYDTTETVVIPFNAFTSDDPSASVTVTNLASTDVYIYKDGSLTQRTSFSGIAVDIDVDAIVGNHWVTVDLSDNTDAGFYVAGSRYQVRMEGVTVDGATINAWIGAFSIGCTLRPTVAGRTLDVAATGEAGVDLGNVTGTLGQANVGWVDANSRIDVGKWLGTAVTTSSTSTKPEVDVNSISDDATAANNLELATENAAAGYLAADLTHIHGTALTETAGRLAGRFVDFFDQASATFSVATALASFKATGFSTHDAAAVKTAIEAGGSKIDHVWEMTEDDGGTRRLTTNALEQAPSGSGGDATAANQATIITHLTDVKGTGFAKDTDSTVNLAHIGADSDTLETLSDQIDGIEGGTGTGARSVTITVDDGTDPLENATVRFAEGGNTYAGASNVSGVIAFSLDDATYAVTIAKAGYTFTPTTRVVDGTETQTYSMAAVSIDAPPNASTTTGVMTVYDEEGVVEESVSVSVQIVEGPGTDGIGYDSTEWTETSNGSGVVQFAGLIHGARYKIWRGSSKPLAQTFTAPTSGDSFDLAEVIGRG